MNHSSTLNQQVTSMTPVSKITFRSLALSDIPLMHHWFNLPHVRKFYSLRSWTEEEVLEKFKPYILGEKPISGFIVLADKNQIAYIQTCKIAGYRSWGNQNLSEEIIKNSAGLDIFIGEKSMIGKGLGGKIMQEFIENKIWPEFQYCVVDPDIKNTAAIRCYEKLHFKEHTLTETVDALDQPVTLKLMILKRRHNS